MEVRAVVLTSHGVNFEIRALHAISGLFVLILKNSDFPSENRFAQIRTVLTGSFNPLKHECIRTVDSLVVAREGSPYF